MDAAWEIAVTVIGGLIPALVTAYVVKRTCPNEPVAQSEPASSARRAVEHSITSSWRGGDGGLDNVVKRSRPNGSFPSFASLVLTGDSVEHDSMEHDTTHSKVAEVEDLSDRPHVM